MVNSAAIRPPTPDTVLFLPDYARLLRSLADVSDVGCLRAQLCMLDREVEGVCSPACPRGRCSESYEIDGNDCHDSTFFVQRVLRALPINGSRCRQCERRHRPTVPAYQNVGRRRPNNTTTGQIQPHWMRKTQGFLRFRPGSNPFGDANKVAYLRRVFSSRSDPGPSRATKTECSRKRR